MTDIIKKILAEKKQLVENFISLSVLQLANYLLPLVTVPYLVRVLGPENYGHVTFAQAFIQYFVIATDYGFNLSATRKISVYRDNKEKVTSIFSSIMLIKFTFMVISLLLMLFIVFAIAKFKAYWYIYFFSFGIVAGNVFFPTWFFQGMESMKYITVLNVISRLLFTIAIFIFIKTQADFLYVPVFNSMGAILAGILSLLIIFKHFGVYPRKVPVSSVVEELKDGWHAFISTMAISLYTISNTFILGLFTNSTIVGYYSAAEKLIKAVQGLLTPVSQAVYPYISKLAGESREKAIVFIRKTFWLIGAGTLLISLTIFIFAGAIVRLVLGEQYLSSIIVLKILAFLPFIVGLSNVFGIQTMLTFQINKPFSRILIAGGIINIILAVILAPLYNHIGVSISVLTTEIFITVTMFLYLNFKGIKIMAGKIVKQGES